jgi:hypothetical protein
MRAPLDESLPSLTNSSQVCPVLGEGSDFDKKMELRPQIRNMGGDSLVTIDVASNGTDLPGFNSIGGNLQIVSGPGSTTRPISLPST